MKEKQRLLLEMTHEGQRTTKGFAVVHMASKRLIEIPLPEFSFNWHGVQLTQWWGSPMLTLYLLQFLIFWDGGKLGNNLPWFTCQLLPRVSSHVAKMSPPLLWSSMNPSHLRNTILRVNEITIETAPRKALIIKNMTAAIRELICFLFFFFETGSHVTQESSEFSVN